MFEHFTSKMKNYGDTIKQGAQNISETASISREISQLRNDINKTYQNLGEDFYRQNRTNVPDRYREFFDHLEQQTAALKAAEKALQDVKGTWVCPNCGAENPKEGRFCGNCGSPRPAVKENKPAAAPAGLCPKCGAPLVEGAMFCGNCGCRLERQEMPRNASTAAQEPAVEPLMQEVDRAVPEESVEELPDVEPETIRVTEETEDIPRPVLDTPVEPTESIAPAAGEQQPEAALFCANCGAKLAPDAAFCQECGAKVC
ncbi:zinc ribbon domain-containing protein [Bilifractor porci]|uniref:Zinc-ribbon domain-containing protein n=1 Tax=Bilifractor porci TaxID=2606636 RepID=A0A7X2P9L0_9FIRM|nr:zinc ribbon domain-containing protein [Bilifractor porci]MST82696.1 zinc-ribbon domain-containing protein [Bilifractor porci]